MANKRRLVTRAALGSLACLALGLGACSASDASSPGAAPEVDRNAAAPSQESAVVEPGQGSSSVSSIDTSRDQPQEVPGSNSDQIADDIDDASIATPQLGKDLKGGCGRNQLKDASTVADVYDNPTLLEETPCILATLTKVNGKKAIDFAGLAADEGSNPPVEATFSVKSVGGDTIDLVTDQASSISGNPLYVFQYQPEGIPQPLLRSKVESIVATFTFQDGQSVKSQPVTVN